MPLDPALRYKPDPSHSFAQLADLAVDPGAIYAFDFDGVIASTAEDAYYRLPQTAEEEPLLAAAAQKFGISCAGMEIRYQRHLLYQAAAWKLGLPIEPGPGFAFAKAASEATGIVILTARSGWYAVERVRKFLAHHAMLPIDTFHVGRVPKDLQVELLATEFAHRQVVYVEDSLPHLVSASALNLPNLILVQCPHVASTVPPDVLRAKLHAILDEAAAIW